MELRVNENIRIVTDSYNYIVQESRIADKDTKKHLKGSVVWEDQSYHGNLPDACKSMVSKGIKYNETFSEVISFLALVYDKIDELKNK